MAVHSCYDNSNGSGGIIIRVQLHVIYNLMYDRFFFRLHRSVYDFFFIYAIL